MADEITYNDPAGGTASEVGVQFRTDHYYKKALIEAKKEQFFSQLADVRAMPKNMGKTIKQYHYLPILDDRNINDQGIDANGATSSYESTIQVDAPDASGNTSDSASWQGMSYYFVGFHASVDATAILEAKERFVDWVKLKYPTIHAALADGTDDAIDYTELSTPGGASLHDIGYRFTINTSVNGAGNLYGSSKDVGTISGKLPTLSETGGRVNRVGFKRIELEGTIAKFGFFDEYTQESMDFDTDAELEMHMTREMVMAANEITEDALQIDLLNGAGVIRYAGSATQTTEISGEAGSVSTPTYNDLMRLEIDLDNNRCPKNTKLISGTRMVDTKTISAARYMYIGSELVPTIKEMTDSFSNQAFIPVQQYASGGDVAVGEIGAIGGFRIIVVPEMQRWAGAGATVTTNTGYHETDNAYDVFPMLVVGSGSFTTIGFQTDGKTVKFKIKHVKPGSDISFSADDPYGEKGFMSIKWYYGSMILRPERIALIKCVAPF